MTPRSIEEDPRNKDLSRGDGGAIATMVDWLKDASDEG
jgi:hypothetical protein